LSGCEATEERAVCWESREWLFQDCASARCENRRMPSAAIISRA